MKLTKLLTGLAAGLFCYAQAGLPLVWAEQPQDAPKDIKHILGFYYGNGENILIRERDGNLELLYRIAQADKSFNAANVYPLKKEHFDAYTLYEAGPMQATEAMVRFERDADGYGIACRVGGHTYSRAFLGQGVGERAKPLRLPERTAEDWANLRTQALEAEQPAALAAGEQAELVAATTVAGLKVEAVYATADNLFGAPLYEKPQLLVAKPAVAALAKVQERLGPYGYGLLLWDSYRPWYVSKLAHLALPAEQKGLLEDPDTKGSPHNTGCAVDVGLYVLETGAAAEMPSGFDEPSLRQYSSYAGGTSKQRWLRTLLRESMELEGFKGIEMEWWHFEYAPETKWAQLNLKE